MTEKLGSRVRALRRRAGMSQAGLARELEISASYLNLIENGRRPLPGHLLLKLAQKLELDLKELAGDDDALLGSELAEAFCDPALESLPVTKNEVDELVAAAPTAARAVLTLYRELVSLREQAQLLASQLADDAHPLGRPLLPPEEVTDFIANHDNYFPALEEAAEALHRRFELGDFSRFDHLARFLSDEHGIEVAVVPAEQIGGVLRRYDPRRKQALFSEALAPRSRHFHLAHQIALLTQRAQLDELLAASPELTSDSSRALARVALANYFAGAVLMPYASFAAAARAERYDIEVLGHRFRTSFEQVCHRLTTLQRPGDEGIRFHFLRVDIAGNISKRFSGSGIPFARFSGVCPRWNVFQAFRTPDRIRRQISLMPDGKAYLCVARSTRSSGGGFHRPASFYALGIGCELKHAKQLVYADGMDLDNLQHAIPIGVTCRLCERNDCAQRVFPSVQRPAPVDENVRYPSLYSAAPQD